MSFFKDIFTKESMSRNKGFFIVWGVPFSFLVFFTPRITPALIIFFAFFSLLVGPLIYLVCYGVMGFLREFLNWAFEQMELEDEEEAAFFGLHKSAIVMGFLVVALFIIDHFHNLPTE